MKIAYILDVFPSGTEHFISNEIFNLSNTDTEIVIFALRRGTYSTGTDPKISKLRVYYIPDFFKLCLGMVQISYKEILEIIGHRNILRRLKHTLISKYFVNILKAQNVDHIHAHFGFVTTDIASHLSAMSKIPFSCTLHARDIYANNMFDLKEKLRFSSFIITCTEYNKGYLTRRLGVNFADRIKVVYHGVNLHQWSHSKPEINMLSNHPVRIVTVGRLIEKKGMIYLLEAIKLLQKRGVLIECNIIGDGPLKKTLEIYSTQNNLNHLIKFKGHLTQREIQEHLCVADIFVLPCIIADDGDRDGIPNALVEAMAMNVPVISTSISAIPEVLRHGINGIMLEQKNSHALAQAIFRLSSDRETYQNMKSNCRSSILEKFDAKNNADTLLKIFKQCEVHA